ncbi:Protein F59C6.8 [Aphelenchoides avenae]|nr:Protein F59C6.8 [Aphelenchus avenae]
MTVLFTASKACVPQVLCWSSDGNNGETHTAVVRKINPHDNAPMCKWTTYIATCPCTPGIREFGLTNEQETSVIELPYREAVKRRLDVVACFAPLFFTDRWQVLALLLEVYRQRGVNMQVYYVQSSLTAILDYLSVYEKLDLVHVEPWYPAMIKSTEHDLGYDPNFEVEWRNQAGAHTDCLIQYKEAADFIFFSDFDEVIFPKLGQTFREEFERLWQMVPAACAFTYQRYNSVFSSDQSPVDYSMLKLLNSTEILNQWMTGKAVVRPQLVETMWIHYMGIAREGCANININETINFMVHIRKWRDVDKISGRRPKYLPQDKEQSDDPFKFQLRDLIYQSDMEDLNRNFRLFVRANASEERRSLPDKMYYYAAFEDCYRVQFYDREEVMDFCPNTLRCNVTSVPKLRCSVVHVDYAQTRLDSLTVHYPVKEAVFRVSENGCYM